MSTEEDVEMEEFTAPVVKEKEIEEPGSQNEADYAEKDDNKATLDLLGPAYARNTQYWKVLIFSGAFQGILLGIIALAFFNLYTALAQATWKRGQYEEALRYNGGDDEDPAVLDALKLGNGEWWYVGMTTSAGLAVGALKVIWSALFPNHIFPERIPGFLKELQALKSEDLWLPLPVLAASGLSIGLGANVGPEAALGFAGASVGTFVARRWRIGPFQAKKFGDNESKGGFLSNVLPDFSNDCDLCSMDGMAAAFAAIFPSQFLAPLLIHELGGHWGPGGKYAFTWTLARTGVAATFGYGFFTGLEDRTLLGQVILPETGYESIPVVPLKDLVFGAVLGIISGVVGFLGFLSLALFTLLGNKISTKLNDLGNGMGLGPRVLGKLLTPVIGGVLVGLICVASPLNLSDGSDQLQTILSHGEILGLDTVIVAGILKIFAGGISIGFGLVGGPIFPLVFTGTCLGVASKLIVPGLNPIIAISTCFVAVPCAFIPGMFFWTLLSSMVFVLGGAATAPVFIGCIASYSTVCGMGLVQDLLIRAKRNEGTEADTSDNSGMGNHNPMLQSASG